MAKLGLSGGGGRRKLQLFGLERVTGADGIVARARTMRSNIEGVKNSQSHRLEVSNRFLERLLHPLSGGRN